MDNFFETGRVYCSQLSEIIKKNRVEKLKDLGLSKDGRIVWKNETTCQASSSSTYDLSRLLRIYIPSEEHRFYEMKPKNILERFCIRMSEPENYINQHFEKWPISDDLIIGCYKFADFVLKKFPVSDHRFLTLGRQNLLINQCLENRLENSGGGHENLQNTIISRPVSNLKNAVIMCIDKSKNIDSNKLNAVFDKIIPEKCFLEGRKLVIIRHIHLYQTMGLVIEYLESYLHSKGIDFCFAFMITNKKEETIKREYPDHFINRNIFYFVLPKKESCMYSFESNNYDKMDIDIVKKPRDNYLLNSEEKEFAFEENSQHYLFADYIKKTERKMKRNGEDIHKTEETLE
nr:hypothetical protein [Endozoicomonas sp.]